MSLQTAPGLSIVRDLTANTIKAQFTQGLPVFPTAPTIVPPVGQLIYTVSTGGLQVSTGAAWVTPPAGPVSSINGVVIQGNSTQTNVVTGTNSVAIGSTTTNTGAQSVVLGTGAPGGTTYTTDGALVYQSQGSVGLFVNDPVAVGGFSYKTIATTEAGATITITALAAIGGYLNFTTAGAIAATLPTGAQLDTAFLSEYVGQTFTCLVGQAATSNVAFTGATGTTLFGAPVTPVAGTSYILHFIRTAGNTWSVLLK